MSTRRFGIGQSAQHGVSRGKPSGRSPLIREAPKPPATKSHDCATGNHRSCPFGTGACECMCHVDNDPTGRGPMSCIHELVKPEQVVWIGATHPETGARSISIQVRVAAIFENLREMMAWNVSSDPRAATLEQLASSMGCIGVIVELMPSKMARLPGLLSATGRLPLLWFPDDRRYTDLAGNLLELTTGPHLGTVTRPNAFILRTCALTKRRHLGTNCPEFCRFAVRTRYRLPGSSSEPERILPDRKAPLPSLHHFAVESQKERKPESQTVF